MSFLQCRHNLATQKSKIPFCSDCTGFPAGYRTRLFKKERSHNRRCCKTTPSSHMRRMEWLTVVRTRVISPRCDFFAYLRHHAVKRGLHPFISRSEIIVGYIPFVPAPMHQSFVLYLYLPVITDGVPGFCTDTNPTFRAEYVESTVPESRFFSQLYQNCYSLLMSRVSNFP